MGVGFFGGGVVCFVVKLRAASLAAVANNEVAVSLNYIEPLDLAGLATRSSQNKSPAKNSQGFLLRWVSSDYFFFAALEAAFFAAFL